MWVGAASGPSRQVVGSGGVPPNPPGGHAHFWRRAPAPPPPPPAPPRTAGALAAGVWPLVLGEAASPERPEPRPIPYGTDFGPPAGFQHVKAPRVIGPETDNPISITDFAGRIGYAIIDGAGTGTDTATGART